MKEYLKERGRKEHDSVFAGLALTVALHVAALSVVSFTGLKYLYPPPQETTFLLDFEEDDDMLRSGTQPQGEDVDPEAPVELVQRSESPEQSTAQNLTPATKPDDFGDVPVNEPPREEEPVLDPRAAFPGMGKKDTTLTAPHSAEQSSAEYKAGQAKGNTESGTTEGKPNAHLEGRKPVGTGLAKPTYKSQERGTVVVKIWVDQYGTVKRAEPGADGTTVTNAQLWNAARKAALETRFNTKADAPVMQEGTITYIFNLK
ncbi:MAG: energy transducer TonB [Bacteroidales bacterium]|nr:energy transducer TonB [Bacteroidales bacterium]